MLETPPIKSTTYGELASLLAGSVDAFEAAKTPVDITLDGDPVEWPGGPFHPTKGGLFAVSASTRGSDAEVSENRRAAMQAVLEFRATENIPSTAPTAVFGPFVLNGEGLVIVLGQHVRE